MWCASRDNSRTTVIFIVYNDLPNCLSHSQPRMFADDTHLTFAGNDITKIERNLNDDLANISQWLIVNKLALNMSKTEFMVIGSRQRLYTFDSAPVHCMKRHVFRRILSGILSE